MSVATIKVEVDDNGVVRVSIKSDREESLASEIAVEMVNHYFDEGEDSAHA